MHRFLPIVFLLAGCANVTVLPTLTPYRIDIQQGNYVTQEMVEKLKPGMTRSQVRFILGTPLVVDPFRTDRWDYVYLYKKRGALTEQRRIAVIFKDDGLARIEGDVVSEKPGATPGGVRVDKPEPGPEAQPAAPAAGKEGGS
jgi:outer membrane protein assembly factor BamE